ncbi:MAG: amino acid adenylation domain-containing protein, partial [Caulobacteraceae bacterium]|nr:amino acid adenylation domain-containing protein [Caulobacter sp.]
GFDLGQAPLLRVGVLRRPDGGYDLVWTSHHALLDGWSQSRLLGELSLAYQALRAGGTPSLAPVRAYRDYIAWLGRRDAAASEAWWRAMLADHEPALLLPSVGERWPDDAAPDAEGRLRDELPEALGAALRATARRRGLTLGTLLQGAWALVLSRWGGRRHVAFGVTVSGRPAELDGVETMLGLFINSLPFWIEVRADEALWAFLDRLQRQAGGLREHEHTPLPLLQRWSGRAGETLFDSLVVLENYPVDAAAKSVAGDLAPQTASAHARPHYPLTLSIEDGDDGFALSWLWDGGRLSGATIAALRADYAAMLEWMAEAGDAHVGDLALPSAAPGELASAIAGLTPFLDVLSRIVSQSRDAVAVVCGDERLDYATLLSRASRVSRRLRPSTEERIGLCAGRSAGLVWGLLGIMGSGAAYVPLDPAYPKARLAQALDDAGIARVVVDAAGAEALGDLADGRQLVRLEEIAAEEDVEADKTPVFLAPHADQLAYVIYTSGSTGAPKGVGISHRSLAALLDAMEEPFAVEQSDRWLAVTSVSFDIATLELLLPLAKGARVIVARKDEVTDGAALGDLMAAHEASIMQATPSGWKLLLASGWRDGGGDWPMLRGISCGEPLSADLAAALAARGVTLWNGYGPTETTIFSSGGPVTAALLDGVPHARLGEALSGDRLCVLGEDGLAVPSGGTGELCIGGAGLARGYLGRPGLTAERFVPEAGGPPGARLYRTGDLVRADDRGVAYLGRLDHQVKLRGHRIELGEIEAALRAVPDVGDAAVMLHGTRLVGYVTGSADSEEARARLAERLPAIMVPQVVVRLDALPLTANGKLDRGKLVEPEAAAAGTAPRDATEARVVQAVTEILGLPRAAIEDDFFRLGGDSISAMRLVVRLRDLGLCATIRQVFEAPVLGDLAALSQPFAAETETETVAEAETETE